MKQKQLWPVLLMLFASLGVMAAARAEENSTLGTHGDFLRSKISAASPLSEKSKTELVEFTQGQYQNGVSFKDKWNADWIRFFEATANDPVKDIASMKQEIRQFWSDFKEKNKPAMENSRSDASDLRHKMRSL